MSPEDCITSEFHPNRKRGRLLFSSLGVFYSYAVASHARHPQPLCHKTNNSPNVSSASSYLLGGDLPTPASLPTKLMARVA